MLGLYKSNEIVYKIVIDALLELHVIESDRRFQVWQVTNRDVLNSGSTWGSQTLFETDTLEKAIKNAEYWNNRYMTGEVV